MSYTPAVREFVENSDLNDELKQFAILIAKGTLENKRMLDEKLAPLITEYAYNRVAAVDRNVMRIAAYEIYFCPAIPPAVSINEAVEIAKKFSMVESGKFVNGILAHVLLDSPKKDWNPETAPAEFEESESAESQSEADSEDLEEILVKEGSDEAKQAQRYGQLVKSWVIKSENSPESEGNQTPNETSESVSP